MTYNDTSSMRLAPAKGDQRNNCVLFSLRSLSEATSFISESVVPRLDTVLGLGIEREQACVESQISRFLGIRLMGYLCLTHTLVQIQPMFPCCLTSAPSLPSPSSSCSDGPRNQSEPRAHAVCHRLRFLRQPQDQRHVLGVLQGPPEPTAEQRSHEPPQPHG